ncbi:MAG: ATP synthase subunit alpha [Candidatus Parcubacteria bacterium]|nr:MAG: ATP synthase subunit alpha [Candidatus Parcubacteria bacterium]GIW67641.1 MAG: ATP synthase subunit alpha [Candidatus Parcubacteria bacterium]
MIDDLSFLIEKLEKEIEKLEIFSEIEEIGEIIRVGDGVVWISGLRNAFVSEVLTIEEKNIFLLVLNLEEGLIGAVAFNDFEKIQKGDLVKRTKNIIQVPVGEEIIGRVIDPLGRPLDDLSPINSNNYLPLERKAPSVFEREPVDLPLHTGIKIIDALIPIGRGQRELILGDRQTGKTSIALDVILNQKNDPYRTPICIYVAIGQKMSKIRRIYEILKKEGALDYTIIVATTPEDSPILLYLAPYAGCSIGEYFRDKGEDALVIYDDLTKHAWAWREISLLLKRPVGREAYPGDIFYIHSRLLERAAKLKNGGSLTALPICETQLGDVSAYIPTNLISITDGQIYLATDLFKANFRPAINIGLSVSRVGSKAQTKIMKKVAGKLKLDLAQFRELEEFAKLSAELPEEIAKKLKRGKILMEILRQENFKPLTFDKISILIYAANNGFFDDFEIGEIKEIEVKLLEYLELEKKEILTEIINQKDLTEEIESKLKESLFYFFENYKK